MFRLLAYFIISGLMLNTCFAQTQAQTQTQAQIKANNDPLSGSGRYSDIVIEAATGHVLHSTNATSLRHPASLTKMMTLYLTFQALEDGRLQLDQLLPVSLRAAHQPATSLGLKAGDTISVRNAIMSIVTQSANDSAVVLAEALSGDEISFSHAMTQQATTLGMSNTHFYNASGLPNPNQVTTASDMATLGFALLNQFPKFYTYFSLGQFNYGGIHYHNHNHLMERYSGMDGIKTGYIGSSGFNLVASAKRGDTRLLAVIFGGSSAVSRDQHMAQLLNQGFDMVQRTMKTQEENFITPMDLNLYLQNHYRLDLLSELESLKNRSI